MVKCEGVNNKKTMLFYHKINHCFNVEIFIDALSKRDTTDFNA